jgi:16S rRNA processing protein RimM
MGGVVGAHGVLGWARVKPFSQSPLALLSYPKWLFSADGESWREREIGDARKHGAFLLAKIAGCDSREAASALAGYKIAVARAALPPLPAGEYYWADLTGMRVISPGGENIGAVSRLFCAGASDVLCVRADSGAEMMIPFVDAYILEVDAQARRIVADWRGDYQ